MTYEESFLATCDAKGRAPAWAIVQIFEEHGLDLNEYCEIAIGSELNDGQTILHYCGY